MSGGLEVLQIREDDVTKMLAATTHIGSENADFQMAQYIFKRRTDGKIKDNPVQTKFCVVD